MRYRFRRKGGLPPPHSRGPRQSHQGRARGYGNECFEFRGRHPVPIPTHGRDSAGHAATPRPGASCTSVRGHTDLHAHGTHIIQSAAGCFVTMRPGRCSAVSACGATSATAAAVADAVHRQMSAVAYPSFFNTTTGRLSARRQACRSRRAAWAIFLEPGRRRTRPAQAHSRVQSALRSLRQDEDPHPSVRLPRRRLGDDEHDRSAELLRAV